MAKTYIVGMGNLPDKNGVLYKKGTVINWDDFPNLHEREELLLEKGQIVIPGKQKKNVKEKSPIEVKIHNEKMLLKKAKEDFKIAKDAFEETKNSILKDIDKRLESLDKEKAAFEKKKEDFEKSKKKK